MATTRPRDGKLRASSDRLGPALYRAHYGNLCGCRGRRTARYTRIDASTRDDLQTDSATASANEPVPEAGTPPRQLTSHSQHSTMAAIGWSSIDHALFVQVLCVDDVSNSNSSRLMIISSSNVCCDCRSFSFPRSFARLPYHALPPRSVNCFSLSSCRSTGVLFTGAYGAVRKPGLELRAA